METYLYEIRLIHRNEITNEPHFHLYTTDLAKAQAFYYGLESIGERETYAYSASPATTRGDVSSMLTYIPPGQCPRCGHRMYDIGMSWFCSCEGCHPGGLIVRQ
jgi:hypothetical protein